VNYLPDTKKGIPDFFSAAWSIESEWSFPGKNNKQSPLFGCHFSPQKNRPPTFRRHLVEAPKSWRCLSIYIIYVYMLYNVIYVYMNVNECLHECKW
jgi:hypothetical protein